MLPKLFHLILPPWQDLYVEITTQKAKTRLEKTKIGVSGELYPE